MTVACLTSFILAAVAATPEAAKNIKGRVLILGAEDPVAPMEELNAVISQFRAAKVGLKTMQSCIGFVRSGEARATASFGSEKKCFISRHLRLVESWHAA